MSDIATIDSAIEDFRLLCCLATPSGAKTLETWRKWEDAFGATGRNQLWERMVLRKRGAAPPPPAIVPLPPGK